MQLTSNADDDTLRLLKLIDIHHPLKTQLLKVHPVCLIIIRAHCFRIIVDHHRPLPHIPQLPCARHCTPIELDTASDPVHARAKYHGTVLIKLDIVLGRVIRCVEVVRVRGIFRRERVDALDEGRNAQGLAVCADGVLRSAYAVGDLGVGEAHAFSGLHEFVIDALDGTGGAECVVGVNDVFNFVEEPLWAIKLVDGRREFMSERIPCQSW